MTPPARDPLEHRTEPYRATTARVVRRRDGARACRQVYLHARRQRSAPDLPAYRSRGRSSNHVFEGAEPVAPIRSSPRSVCARDGVRTAGWGTASLRRRGLSQRRVISLRGRFLWARFPARRPFFLSFLSHSTWSSPNYRRRTTKNDNDDAMSEEPTSRRYQDKDLDEVFYIAETLSGYPSSLQQTRTSTGGRVLAQVLGFKFSYYQVRLISIALPPDDLPCHRHPTLPNLRPGVFTLPPHC